MSWSPDLYIGELRPWPDSVHVVRGKTGEVRRYMPERKDGQAALEQRIDELCQENEQLRQELAIRESSEQEKVIDYLGKECVDWEDKYLALAGENVKLRELAHGFAIYRHFDCQHCGYREQCKAGQTNCYKAYVDLVKRAKELGIEVTA